jgi:hypothetical protein
MEVIEHDGRVRQIAGHRSDIRLRHVHSNSLDTGSGRFEPLPERFQGIGTFAFADENNGSTVEIEHDCQVSMSVTNADLVDSDAPECLQRRAGELPLQESLLDLFDRMPTDSQVLSHILHGHVSGEFQDVAVERPGVPPVRIGERDARLPRHATAQAMQPLNEALNQGRTQTDRESLPHTQYRPLLLHGSTPTTGTRKRRGVLVDPEHGTAFLKSRMDMVDSSPHDPKTVVEYARGHGFLAFSDLSQNQRTQEIMSSFSLQRWYALTRRAFFRTEPDRVGLKRIVGD